MGMSRPSYGRGQGSFFGRRPPPMRNPRMPMPPMNKPLPFMPQSIPQRPQMPMDGGYDGSGFMGGLMAKMGNPPRRMPGGPSKGGNTTTFPPMQGPMRGPQMPPMQRPPMQRPGGPGKARTGPRGGLMRRGRGSLMRGGPGKGRGQPQMPMPQKPINMPPMEFAQPTARPVNQTMGRPMPQQPFMGRVGNNMPQPPMNFPQPTLRPDQTMGRPMPQPNFILGPMNRGGFYSGGITDLY